MKSLIVVLFFVTAAFAVNINVPRVWNGVLDENGQYIPGTVKIANCQLFAYRFALNNSYWFNDFLQRLDSILVWAQNALRAMKWADWDGKRICRQWHDAVVRYNAAVAANQPTDALGHFYIIPVLLTLAQPYLYNDACRQWFKETAVGFGNVVHGLGVQSVTLPEANDYMIERYPAFERACGPRKHHCNCRRRRRRPNPRTIRV